MHIVLEWSGMVTSDLWYILWSAVQKVTHIIIQRDLQTRCVAPGTGVTYVTGVI